MARWVGPLVWGYDPQDAPLEWVQRTDTPIMTDIDGVDIVELEDQDGETFVWDLEEYRHGPDRY